jgi:TonB-linked SusC/RagA family outer membrane protein
MNKNTNLTNSVWRRLSLLTLLCVFSFALFAQTKTVSGIVKSSDDGQPLIGVAVLIKGSKTGSITDVDGKYTINVKNNEATLVFSMIGMKPVEVKVGEKAVINVVMNSDVKVLDQVVVTGYTTQKKADLTGAITVVEPGSITAGANAANPIESLQGRIPGMNITSDGSPSGNGTSIKIRGIGTINSNDPLYVIDGVPTTGGMQVVNPNDIESLQVLKDASAASIYGSRAANGVIIITTKKAKDGQLKITASTQQSFSWYSTVMHVLNAQQYGQCLWQAKVNANQDPNGNSVDYSFDWNGNYTNPVLNKVIIPDYIDAAKTMKSADTNWFKEITQVAHSQNYNMSIMNGSDKGHTMFALDYTNNNGIVITTNFTRYSARLNSDYKLLNGKLLVGENLTLSHSSEVVDQGAENLALQAMPIIPVHTVDGVGWGGPYGGMNDRMNPVLVMNLNKQNKVMNNYLFGNVFADLELVKNLHIKSNFGLDYNNAYERLMTLNYQDGYLSRTVNAVTNSNATTSKWTWSNTVSYNFKKDKHTFDVLAGIEVMDEVDESNWGKGQAFASENPNYMYLDNATGTQTVGGTGTEYALLSYFGKANYVYDNKYLASATIRYDGSSRFGANNRFGTFPAFSLGWRLNRENFMKDLKQISDLKLRFGWGMTGNQNIANNATQTIYVTNYSGGDPTWTRPTSTAYAIDGSKSGTLASGYMKTQTGNSNLKWEATTQTNFGLDFGLFDQSVYGSFDYFVKKTSDILVSPPFIAVQGEGGSEWFNGAGMSNKGFELALGYRGKFGPVKFDISGNISAYRNKITSLPASVVNAYGGNGTTDNILGHAWGSGYGYVADGLFTSADQVTNSATQPGKGLGRIRYKDLNGDGVIDTKDQTWIFDPTPSFAYGLNIYLTYKDFDLTIFLQGLGKTDVVNSQKYSTDFWSVQETGSNKGTRLLNAWSPSNPNSTIPAIAYTNDNNEDRYSTYFIENGAYCKLRNLQIGYNLPKSLTEKLKLGNLNLYISGHNLVMIKAKSFTGTDPESPAYGYPIPSSVTAGLKVSF